MGRYTIEIAYQRAQGRRPHQEDYVSLCSLRSYSTQQFRHDKLLEKTGKFEAIPQEEATDHEDDYDTIWAAIFDGHGGSAVSEHCASNMQNRFLKRFANLSKVEKTDEDALKKILETSFLTFDDEIRELPAKTEVLLRPSCLGTQSPLTITKPASVQGATATILTLTKLFEDDAILSIGHAGDSRLVLFTVENLPNSQPEEEEVGGGRRGSLFPVTSRFSKWMGSEANSSVFGSYYQNSEIAQGNGLTKKDSQRLRKVLRGSNAKKVTLSNAVRSQKVYETVDHQPTNDNEARRVIELGGRVINMRVNGVLAVSRALGDHDQKKQKGLCANPDLATFKLSDLVKSRANESEHAPPTPTSVKSRLGDISKEEEEIIKGKEVIVVMASDGLWTYAGTKQVQSDVTELLARGYSLKEITQVLMDKIIIDHRGIDNTTITLIRIMPTEMHVLKEDINSRMYDERLTKGMKTGRNGGKGTMRSYGSAVATSVMEVEIPKTKESEV